MFKSKKIKFTFLIYWFLLIYILAALVWWFIALSRQNEQAASVKLQELNKDTPGYEARYSAIEADKKRKAAQYIGEGSIFFLVTIAGAIFVYRTVNRELRLSRQQQNFMMAVTHELKTPIAVAKLNLETLQRRKLDDTQQQRLINNTLDETNRLNILCNNLLISSQIEAGGYVMTGEDINISELVNNTVKDFKTRFPQRVFSCDIEKDIFVHGDNLLLQIAINNLVDNAIKYSPKENAVAISLVRDSIHAVIQVKDEGAGIADAEKKKIFEKFYRVGNEATKRAKGTGLGLFLTRKIIIGHRGRIYVKDNSPKGSIFTIELKEVV